MDLDGSNVEVVGVTAPRYDQLWGSAMESGVSFMSTGVWPDLLQESGADVVVSAQNYAKITAEAREAVPMGAIGYHPSLLPRHRGRSAIEWTIGMGDPIAGGTVYLMDDGWDTGPIIAQDFCHVVPGWTPKDLWAKQLFPMGIRLLTRVIVGAAGAKLLQPSFTLVDQDERVATVEPRWEGGSPVAMKDRDRLVMDLQIYNNAD